MFSQTKSDSYASLGKSKCINAGRIYDHIARAGKGFTRQELAKVLDLPINVICPRVKELIVEGLLIEHGTKKNHLSGKRVGLVWLRQ